MTQPKDRLTDEPVGELERVADFLPPPDQLVPRDDGVKVTLYLSRTSVDFFKAEAARARVPYQRMIRNLLDAYALRHGRGHDGGNRKAPRKGPA